MLIYKVLVTVQWKKSPNMSISGRGGGSEKKTDSYPERRKVVGRVEI